MMKREICVTIKELNNNLDFYLEKSFDEDVFVIDENENKICVLANPQHMAFLDAVSFVESLEKPEQQKDENGNVLPNEDILGNEIMKRNGF